MDSGQCLQVLVAFLSVSILVLVVDGGALTRDADTKIVGGKEIEISEVPWQVSLHVDKGHVCGGSIINRRWVLTAAHCTHGIAKSRLKILIGTKSIKEGGSWYSVEDVKIHDGYVNELPYSNDISVIKTTEDMKLDLPVKVVTLADKGMKRPPLKAPLTVSGWGRMENEQSPTLLRAVDMEVKDILECDYRETNSSTEICAGLPGKNFCMGDSGGPVMMRDVQVGVVSNFRVGLGPAFGCGGYPSISMYVPAYIDWIKAHTSLQ